MTFIDEQLIKFKQLIEEAIVAHGAAGKDSIIRSSVLINLIHDAIKKELIDNHIDCQCIYPHFKETKPEIKLAGFLKQKDQDVCVLPKNIEKNRRFIDWGPLKFQRKIDDYGDIYTTNTLVINIRSQMSSLAKNADTLFERTFAEAMNLHMKYPNIILGDVYLIPVYEYDDESVKNNTVSFKNKVTDLEKYITPKLYTSSKELKDDGLISPDFNIEYASINFSSFIPDLLEIYDTRYILSNILSER